MWNDIKFWWYFNKYVLWKIKVSYVYCDRIFFNKILIINILNLII